MLLQRQREDLRAGVPRTRNDSMLEELSESISRALAARVSRRSFLGRMSTGAVAASIGTTAVVLTRPPAAAACTHNCSISCVDLTGSNNCPSNRYTTCTCGSWCFSDSGCASGIRRWEDCCGINYCNVAGGCRCVSGYPTCCNTKTYSDGCGTVGQSVVVCRLRFCVTNCTVINNYCS